MLTALKLMNGRIKAHMALVVALTLVASYLASVWPVLLADIYNGISNGSIATLEVAAPMLAVFGVVLAASSVIGEFRRVLAPGGFVVKAIPTEHHLHELRERASGQLAHDDYSNERVIEHFKESCELLSTRRVTRTQELDPEALDAFKKRKHQFMSVDREGRDVFMADSNYVLQMAQTDFPKIKFHFTSEF